MNNQNIYSSVVLDQFNRDLISRDILDIDTHNIYRYCENQHMFISSLDSKPFNGNLIVWVYNGNYFIKKVPTLGEALTYLKSKRADNLQAYIMVR